MEIDSDEWYKQSEYDFRTAEKMFESGRHIYAVFMCHLSIEKALKGLFVERIKLLPPKSHNLMYFVDKLELKPESNIDEFLTLLNDQGIATRYPESLEKLILIFSKEKTELIIEQTRETLEWIKAQSKI